MYAITVSPCIIFLVVGSADDAAVGAAVELPLSTATTEHNCGCAALITISSPSQQLALHMQY